MYLAQLLDICAGKYVVHSVVHLIFGSRYSSCGQNEAHVELNVMPCHVQA